MKGFIEKRLRFQNRSFMTKTLCCLLSVVLLTLVISAAIIVPRLREILQTNYHNTMNLTLNMVRQNIENTISHYERMAYLINGSDELNQWLLEPVPRGTLPRQKQISDFLSSNIVGDRYIRSIVVRCTDGRVYSYSRYNELGVKYLSELIDPKTYPAEAHGGFRWIYDSTLLPLSPAESKESRILLTGVIKNRSDVYKNQVIATFVMEYDVDVIRRLYQDANIDGFGGIEVWVTSEPVYPIIQYSKERPDLAYRQAVDGLIASGGSQVVEWNNTLLSSCPIDRVDWHLVGAVDTQGIHAKITELEQDLYVVLLLEFVLAVFLSVMLAFQITRPIKGLIACMKRVEKGDLSVQIPVEREDELGKLSASFNHMMTQLDDLIHEVYEVKCSEKEAQIAAMRAQMNPHFLYNTLDAISWTVSFGENEQACEMIACLSDILRYSIKGSAFVTMRNEIEQASNYLYLQQMRMGEALRYSIEISEEIMECRVLKFFLQPIVENAILHGLQGCNYAGELVVSARIEQDDLRICVADNGTGIAPERIGRILDGTEKPPDADAGIGLCNVNQRIKLTYADERYGIAIESAGRGTRVYLTLPVRF